MVIVTVLITSLLCSEYDSPPEGGAVTQPSSPSERLNEPTPDDETAPVARTAWSPIRYYTDEMTGEQSFGAYSDETGPTRAMEWPYHDVTARIYFSCDAGRNNEAAWIRFSSNPNLVDTDTQSGYDVITTRIRWDDKPPESATLTQQWSSEDVSFMYDGWAIGRIEASGAMLLELHWYDSGRVFFRFDLTGSAEALNEARARCRGE